jgi:hypothetical protein
MTEYSKPETVSLSDLLLRIKSTDLVPSRAALLEDIDILFERISKEGIQTWMDLQKAIKNPKNIESFSKATGINPQYLVLLLREIEGYHPKSFDLVDIDWVSQDVINELVKNGITNSEELLSKNEDQNCQLRFAEQVGIDPKPLDYLVRLSELTRVQWVSPITARMLIEAGCDNCQKLASADGEILCAEVDRVNKQKGYFNGKIGLRDINRLIQAAKYTLL